MNVPTIFHILRESRRAATSKQRGRNELNTRIVKMRYVKNIFFRRFNFYYLYMR